ncbi:hypothetical protein KWH26_003710 [Salmonella enterica]|nr:hypothetical protein [Salmonella enterica]
MKRLWLIIPAVVMLSGCPGKGNIVEKRGISVDSERVCFSVDKHDVLTTYYLSSNEGGEKEIMASDTRKPISLSYPATCFNIALKKGFQYGAYYTLNNKPFRYDFFIDNNGNVVSK